MENIRRIKRDRVLLNSRRHFEISDLSIWSGYETGLTNTELRCESPKSPVIASLCIDENSDDFREIFEASKMVTKGTAAASIRDSRKVQKQSHGGNIIETSLDIERSIGTLVLAHFSPKVPFGFKMLEPDTVSTFKLLVLEHQSSPVSALLKPLVSATY